MVCLKILFSHSFGEAGENREKPCQGSGTLWVFMECYKRDEYHVCKIYKSSSSSSSSSSCSWRVRHVILFLDPQDEVGPSISSSVVLCSFVLLVYIVVLVLVVCLCPSSVRVVATFPGTVLFPLLCSVLQFFPPIRWSFSLPSFVIPSKCLKNFIWPFQIYLTELGTGIITSASLQCIYLFLWVNVAYFSPSIEISLQIT